MGWSRLRELTWRALTSTPTRPSWWMFVLLVVAAESLAIFLGVVFAWQGITGVWVGGLFVPTFPFPTAFSSISVYIQVVVFPVLFSPSIGMLSSDRFRRFGRMFAFFVLFSAVTAVVAHEVSASLAGLFSDWPMRNRPWLICGVAIAKLWLLIIGSRVQGWLKKRARRANE